MLIHRIVRNQVHIRQLANVLNQLSQLERMLSTIIDVSEQNIFNRNPTIRLRQVVFNGFHQRLDRNRFVDFHNASTKFVRWRMQGDR
ncbi:hypothetical protein D3C86_1846880 [compost metagenome]